MEVKHVEHGMHETEDLEGYGKVRLSVIGTQGMKDGSTLPICQIYGPEYLGVEVIDWDNGKVVNL